MMTWKCVGAFCDAVKICGNEGGSVLFCYAPSYKALSANGEDT